MQINNRIYETEMPVRPDDIDMFRHVHSSRYIDYVLAARYDQMARCYGNPMSEYLEKGLGWVVNTCHLQFKRALKLGDTMRVQTQLTEVQGHSVKVLFFILSSETGKVCCEGYFDYTLISLQTGKAEAIPEWALNKYLL